MLVASHFLSFPALHSANHFLSVHFRFAWFNSIYGFHPFRICISSASKFNKTVKSFFLRSVLNIVFHIRCPYGYYNRHTVKVIAFIGFSFKPILIQPCLLLSPYAAAHHFHSLLFTINQWTWSVYSPNACTYNIFRSDYYVWL